jgi:predicted ATPase
LNGIQRDRFLPFIGLLERKCQVVDMWESETDYRLVQKKPDHGTVFFVGKDGRKAMDELFYDLVGQAAVAPTALQTQGRRVNVPQAATSKGIARFTFKDLCQKALGAADYLVIGEHYHTVFVELVPTLTMNELNWVRRFIVFVDSMYECHVKLVLHAHNDMLDIFQRPQDDTDHDEVFAFDRTLSRLEEMSSETYLKKRWGGKTEKTKMATKQDDVRSSSKIEVQPVQEADYDQQRFQTDRSLR